MKYNKYKKNSEKVLFMNIFLYCLTEKLFENCKKTTRMTARFIA